jgi:hypothetical protein
MSYEDAAAWARADRDGRRRGIEALDHNQRIAKR